MVNVFDIGVLATHGEGISNSIMEYMALGKPVVASEGGGTCELVQDGITGFLVPRRDPQALAARISQLLDDQEAGRRMPVHRLVHRLYHRVRLGPLMPRRRGALLLQHQV